MQERIKGERFERQKENRNYHGKAYAKRKISYTKAGTKGWNDTHSLPCSVRAWQENCASGWLAELKAQGRNINQLAVLANMGRINNLQVEDLLNAYGKIYSLIEKLAREVK